MISSVESTPRAQLQRFQAEMEAELHNILRFWQEESLDERHGGFIGKMDHQGHVVEGAPKGGVLHARILWTFSAAFRQTGAQKHLQLAERAYHYLMQHFLDREKGGVFWAVTAQGEPLNTRKQVYALAFALYGFSEYYRATADTEALEVSKSLYQWIEAHSFDPEHGGYFEAFSREGELLQDLRLSEKDRNDPKTMNTHLHILEAYANLYRIWPDAELARQLRGLLRVFLDRIIDPQTGHMKLFFTSTWEATADLVSYGHDVEASWLLLEAAEVLGEPNLITEVSAVALKMAQATTGGLQADGSLYHELDRTQGHIDRHREWWVSAEAMVGFMNAYQLSGDGSFLNHSLKSWQFVQQHLLDAGKGEWIWGVYDDYSPMLEEDKIGFWKCPYHNSRACIELIHRCQQLLQK